MEVSVVIPNYNGEKLLTANLPKVVASARNKINRISEIIVVDDASTDESVALVKKKFPEVRVVKHRVNRGFSATVNTGARSAKGDLLVLLNTDVSPEQDFLEYVFPHFKERDVFGVSLHETGFGWAKGKFLDGFIVHESGPETESSKETFWVSGGSGVFLRSFWMKLGGMSEKLFKFYWEDVDLSYRAQKRGLKLFWEPRARVVHMHESVTSARFTRSQLNIMQEVNQLMFIWKNLTSPNLIRRHVLGLARRVSRHPGYIRVVVSALFRLLTILRERRKEKKEARISDEAIFAKFA